MATFAWQRHAERPPDTGEVPRGPARQPEAWGCGQGDTGFGGQRQSGHMCLYSVRQRRMISLCPAGLTQALKVWENWLGESHERARLDL